MKKTQKCSFLLLFFIIFFNFLINFLNFVPSVGYLISPKTSEKNRKFEICLNQKKYTFYSFEVLSPEKLTPMQREIMLTNENFEKVADKLFSFGLSQVEVCDYLFPEVKEIFKKLSDRFYVQSKQGSVKVIPNSCKICFDEGVSGVYADKQSFYSDAFSQLLSGKTDIKINLALKEFKGEDIKNLFKEKSSFSTNFSSSGEARKNNIKVALQKFDGLILEEGESFSFNEVTGERNESTGYAKAKIISGGTFVEGFGGGVCQVSTTLYNACLLAGLEIVEVHSHSLPVSYVEPSFDAMVNSGSSDLIVRNNTGGKILLTTSNQGDQCRVKIFGLKNKYKITRISEKVKLLPAKEEVVDTEYEKYGELDLEVGEEKRISVAKDGFVSNGYLNFYDEGGRLIKTQKIRENRYNPTKGVIVKREA